MIVVGRSGSRPQADHYRSRARVTPRDHDSVNMPSLSRVIILFAFVSAFAYGIMVVLANSPQPVQRQIVVGLPEE